MYIYLVLREVHCNTVLTICLVRLTKIIIIDHSINKLFLL